MVDQALRGEPAEQAPSHAVFEMQVHHVVAEPAGVLEGDGPDGGPAAPFAEALASLPAHPQRIECSPPARIACEHLVIGGKDELARADRLATIIIDFLDCWSPGELEAHRQGPAELRCGEADMEARAFQARAQPIDLDAQPVLAKAGVLQLFLDDSLALASRQVPDGGPLVR